MSDRISAWRVATSTCPFCVAEDTDFKEACLPCGGTGDLFAFLLEGAYREGREDGLHGLRKVYEAVKVAGESVRDQPVPDMRARAGWANRPQEADDGRRTTAA